MENIEKWLPCLTIYKNQLKVNKNDLYFINQDLQRRRQRENTKALTFFFFLSSVHKAQEPKAKCEHRIAGDSKPQSFCTWKKTIARAKREDGKNICRLFACTSKEFISQCLTAENTVSMRSLLAADPEGMLSHTHPVSLGNCPLSSIHLPQWMHGYARA